MEKMIKILLIEDNTGDAYLIEEQLEEFANFRYEVRNVGTLNEALTLLSKKRYFCLDLSSKPLPIDISFFLHLLILTNKFTLKSLLLLFYVKKYL